MSMAEVTATEAARSFADLLDAVEHRGERFTIVRRGKAIARLQPVSEGHGAAVKELLRRHGPDRGWMRDVAAVRSLVELEERG
ncbi:MAG: type II toxin-antitoxin system Phd/YefM family antitoxin [Actinomycetota bacterium]|nr:type II toxin-antitoxin system Phd/YefM family antitoxin [Actinomycetota bacterium]